ncbi:MAG: excinuclease ABC subunit UvrA [Candidatus Cryptobacteroides sp.]|nr:excinuclease ABC subunit UvrA [Bacteroidales bacterium]MDY6158409.1 excinuclease ABC subunit UvrA [Candidatus Cryptobacteroides sp.]
MKGKISIRGARVNNLKNLSLDIPRNRLVVVTGVSGSGKSSLVFDTLYAEGQRRFSESLSSYARQFLGRMSKPDVDSIEGIPPAIAIEQKVSTRNPRSTVATTTEIYDFIRLIFARIGRTYSPVSGEEVRCDGVQDVLAFLESRKDGVCYVLAGLGWEQREDKVELLLSLKEEGYNRTYSPGRVLKIDDVLRMDGDYPETLYLLLDRVRCSGSFDPDTRTRLLSSVADAFNRGAGYVYVADDQGILKSFCNRFERDGIVFRKPDDYLFSFNSPLGACPHCGGLGKIIGVSEDLVVPDKTKSIYDGAIACWRGDKMGWFKDQLIKVASRFGIPIFEPYCKLSDEQRRIIWKQRSNDDLENSFVGLDEFFEWVDSQKYKIQFKYMMSRFCGRATCPECGGSRLRKEALWVRVCGRTIDELLQMNIDDALDFFKTMQITDTERAVVAEPLSETISRLQCIKDVGLSYLTLNRACNTLSGGESQRINLVTSLGSSLVGSMYILDEPSIGLHPRDTARLIAVLKRLRDLGNTVIVVEHDEDIMRAADLLIDMGPGAGAAGGEVVYNACLAGSGSLPEAGVSLTLDYLYGRRSRYTRLKRSWQYSISVKGAMEHNLKDIDVRFPLGVLTVVTGVSGSGKSSLVGDILYPALNRRLNDSGDSPGLFRALDGNLDRITRVEYVDQNPIGRSSRSNAVTYLNIYDDIRKLLAAQQYSKINGFGPNYFSFNKEGGRCPECQGEGVVRIPMQFMADVEMVCETCGGKRFKPEVLEVRYREKNIDDLLNMSVDEAVDFFSEGKEELAQSIAVQLEKLQAVGLGYIKLGQSSSTLSGGESQRIKLAYYLSLSVKKSERIMFIFDEPTTGLHFYDVEKLLKAFDTLLAAGHSLVVVEHNPDVIRAADWVIDLGPDAGNAGGEVVFEGTPEELVKQDTFTAKYI